MPTCPHCGFRPATHTSRDEVDGIIRPACDVCDPADAEPVDDSPEPRDRQDTPAARPRVAEAIAAGNDTLTTICAFLGIPKTDKHARHLVSSALQNMLLLGQVTREPIDPANPHFKRWALTGASVEHKKPWSRRKAA